MSPFAVGIEGIYPGGAMVLVEPFGARNNVQG